jgi:hypothetical protein
MTEEMDWSRGHVCGGLSTLMIPENVVDYAMMKDSQ